LRPRGAAPTAGGAAAVARHRPRDSEVGPGRGARRRAQGCRTRRGRLRAVDEAGGRPPRPTVDRGGRSARPSRPAGDRRHPPGDRRLLGGVVMRRPPLPLPAAVVAAGAAGLLLDVAFPDRGWWFAALPAIAIVLVALQGRRVGA